MPVSQSRLERVYMQTQTAFDLIPGGNTSGTGTATVGNANCCRHIKVGMENNVDLLVRRDKTGSRTATAGIAGRKFARWSFEASLAPHGTAGTVPDFDPLLQAAFNQASASLTGTIPSITAATNATPIVVTSTAHGLSNGDLINISGVLGNTAANGVWIVQAVTANTFELIGSVGNGAYTSGGTGSKVSRKYTFADDPLAYFTLWSFRQPSTLNQRVAFGCNVNELTFNLGADIAEFSASGEAKWMLESDFFSSADSDQKGGISAFPTEPAAPVTNGGIIAGFTGRAVIGGSTIARIRTAQVKINNGSDLVKDTFGKYYPDDIEADTRNVSISFSFYDTDDTAIKAIRNAGNTKAGVDVVLNLGTVTGSTVVLWLKGVQLATHTLDDGQRRFVGNVGESRAFGTSLTAKDELVMWIA